MSNRKEANNPELADPVAALGTSLHTNSSLITAQAAVDYWRESVSNKRKRGSDPRIRSTSEEPARASQ